MLERIEQPEAMMIVVIILMIHDDSSDDDDDHMEITILVRMCN